MEVNTTQWAFFPVFFRVHRQQRTSRAVLLLAYGALKQKLLYLKTPLVGIMVHRAPTASKMVDKQTSRNWDVLRRKSCWGDGLMLGEWGGLTGVWRSRWRPSAAEILSVLSFGSPRSSCKAFRVFSLITCETIECAFFALLFTPSLVFFSSSLCVFAFDCFVPVHTLGLGTPLSGRTAKISCHICFLLSPSHSMFYLFCGLVSVRLSSVVNTRLIRKSSYLAERNVFSLKCYYPQRPSLGS